MKHSFEFGSSDGRFPLIGIVHAYLATHFPFFAKVIQKRVEEFGEEWTSLFEEDLRTFFGHDTSRLEKAVHGYGVFALDAMKLQVQFDKTHEYIAKRYADVSQDVYMDRDYMFELYLPGILLSHFLWPHHYRQREYFRTSFLPLVTNAALFYDVGVGTGFYSKEFLRLHPRIQGRGFDISPHSLEHTKMLIERWGFAGRYSTAQQDVIATPPDTEADCMVNVEVLEHLEDPETFLRALHRMLKKGGLVFISAAIDAPNADHIYLYRTLEDVTTQVQRAGFTIVDAVQYHGYEPTPTRTAPSNGICIARK